jgi:ribosomal protein S18 acetylase RimI-like enzyme
MVRGLLLVCVGYCYETSVSIQEKILEWTRIQAHFVPLQGTKNAKFLQFPSLPPMAVTVRILQPSEARLVASAAPGVFDHAPQFSLTTEFLKDPWHHLVAAIDEGRVVGFISAMHYLHPDKLTELWINEVGVAPSHRSKGIGAELLRTMLEHGRKLGCVNAWVLSDKANTAAMRLYAGAGGVEVAKPAVMFEFDLAGGGPVGRVQH